MPLGGDSEEQGEYVGDGEPTLGSERLGPQIGPFSAGVLLGGDKSPQPTGGLLDEQESLNSPGKERTCTALTLRQDRERFAPETAGLPAATLLPRPP